MDIINTIRGVLGFKTGGKVPKNPPKLTFITDKKKKRKNKKR
jgi:hypothetical protein